MNGVVKWLWPSSETFVVETPLTKDEVIARIRAVTKPYKSVDTPFLRPRTDGFLGKVTEEGFEVRVFPWWRDRYPPTIVGKVTQSASESSIRISVEPSPFIRFLRVFFLLVFIGALASNTKTMLGGNDKEALPLLGFIFAWVIFGLFGERRSQRKGVETAKAALAGALRNVQAVH